jgi:hypothetical protein
MRDDPLEMLDEAVGLLLAQDAVRRSIAELRAALKRSTETFVWSVLDCAAAAAALPAEIRSGWIFVLKRDTPSGAHYHPNSVQHMVMVEGGGWSDIAGERRRMLPFRSQGHALHEVWYVIDRNIPHEFFPVDRDMVVISFHTCAADELQEISCDTGESRFYTKSEGGV